MWRWGGGGGHGKPVKGSNYHDFSETSTGVRELCCGVIAYVMSALIVPCYTQLHSLYI